jgi:hypothetical protein
VLEKHLTKTIIKGLFNMKFKFLHAAIISIILLTTTAQATLITEEWSAKVTGWQNMDGINLHETFSWLVTYDDSSLLAHTYSDGEMA